MKFLFKRLTCIFRGHVYEWRRALYGDEICHSGFKRNLYICLRCSKWHASGEVPLEKGIYFVR